MRATDPATWRIDRPDEIRDGLRAAEWPTVFMGASIAYLVCPLCGSMVPTTGSVGVKGLRTPPRVAHIQWHIRTAKLLEDLERPASSFRPDEATAW